VLGAAASGKTCLINAYVNNTCPNVYTPTENPTLYHRTLRTETEDDDPALATVLLEIEDTYSSERIDGKDHFGRNRSANNFIVLKKPGQPPHKSDLEPFSDLSAPKESFYEPFAKGRMAFIVVFDINDESSWESAQKVFGLLNERHKGKVGEDNEPVVYLVANKIDQDPMGEAPVRLRHNVEAWQRSRQDYGIRFKYMEVSALEFTKVRRLFRNIVDEILVRPELYKYEGDTDGGMGAEGTLGSAWGVASLFGGSTAAGPASIFGGLSLWGGGQ